MSLLAKYVIVSSHLPFWDVVSLAYYLFMKCAHLITDTLHSLPITFGFTTRTLLACGTDFVSRYTISVLVVLAGIIHKCGLRKKIFRRRYRRVVGGVPSEAFVWPWLVSIELYSDKTRSYQHICGGSMVDSRWILTAAHCIYRYTGVHSWHTHIQNIQYYVDAF